MDPVLGEGETGLSGNPAFADRAQGVKSKRWPSVEVAVSGDDSTHHECRVPAARRQGEGHGHRPLHRRPDDDRAGDREVPLRRPPSRAHPAASTLRRPKALPGVVAVVTQDDLPDVRFGGFVQDRTLFAKDVVRFEGEIVAGVAALTEADRERGRRG